MNIKYDHEIDVLRIIFSNNPIAESDEEKNGLILDYDKDGNVVKMEILQACRRIEEPFACDYAVTAEKRRNVLYACIRRHRWKKNVH
jgi:uncharacterized protein YuzE